MTTRTGITLLGTLLTAGFLERKLIQRREDRQAWRETPLALLGATYIGLTCAGIARRRARARGEAD